MQAETGEAILEQEIICSKIEARQWSKVNYIAILKKRTFKS